MNILLDRITIDPAVCGGSSRTHCVGFDRLGHVKIKLDENIGRRGLELLKGAGHDVMTM